MHMRKKPWMEPTLQQSGLLVENPESQAGRWQAAFPEARPLELDLGCGKCVSTARMALANPGVNYLAIDESRAILGIACRVIDEAFQGQKPDNLRLAAYDIQQIQRILAPSDTARRLHVSFCNPWTQKSRHYKRRLTHTRQLEQYKTFLAPDGEIWFKTDDEALFTDSLRYFAESGFRIAYRTEDLHASDFSPNYESEHEQRYVAQGIPIRFLIAQYSVDQ